MRNKSNNSRRKKTNGLKRSSSYQLSVRKWPARLLKLWHRQEKQKKNLRWKNCLSLILQRSSKKLNSASTPSSLSTKKSRMPVINMSVKSRTHHKIWLKWRSVLKFYKMRLRSWETSPLRKIVRWLTLNIKFRRKFIREILIELTSMKRTLFTNKRSRSLGRKLMKEISWIWSLTHSKKKWMI